MHPGIITMPQLPQIVTVGQHPVVMVISKTVMEE